MNNSSVPPGLAEMPTPPQGEEIASFATYAQAQAAVDSLSDQGFPLQALTIIGTDLRQIERITGRMSWGKAIGAGAASGIWLGLLFAALLTIVQPNQRQIWTVIACVALGVVWGVVSQVLQYAARRGRRDFTSVTQVVASRYAILASVSAMEAARFLAQVPGNLRPGGEAAARRAQRAAAASTGPTPFGSRPDERPRFGVRIEKVAEQGDEQDGGSAIAGSAPNMPADVRVAPVEPADVSDAGPGSVAGGRGVTASSDTPVDADVESRNKGREEDGPSAS